MRNFRTRVGLLSLGLLSAAGATVAADAPADATAKPVLPSVSDILDASGLTATGYVSGTYSAQSFSASHGVADPHDTNSFILQQAAFTLAKQPTAGFGALVNVIAGQNIYTANYSYGGASSTTTQFQLAQAYAQYIGGPFTVIAGKFVTLAGAEVLASSGNTNITRSLLYSFEPVTHTGARLTYAATDQISLIVGANNGWIYSDENSATAGPGKTLELGAAWAPSKAFSWTLQGYVGDDTNFAGERSRHLLVDTVVTWNVNSSLSVLGSVDYGNVARPFGNGTPNADFYGIAGYVNYAINDAWRVSGRLEYFDDKDGYLTNSLLVDANNVPVPAVGNKLKEGTVDLGYAPVKNIELRLEGRFDSYDKKFDPGTGTFYRLNVAQGWLEALYKF
jgi:hypothetical protein